MKNKLDARIFGNIKFTIFLIVLFLGFDKLFEAIGSSMFFGVNFQIVPWIILILVVISFISDLNDVEGIKRILNRKFKWFFHLFSQRKRF